MSTSLNALSIRRWLNDLDDQPGRVWSIPEEFGPDGWRFMAVDGEQQVAEVLTTVADHEIMGSDAAKVGIIHASIVVLARMPTYEEMVLLHKAVFGEKRWSYQVFAPSVQHVNIHGGALHLWGRFDGEPMMFNFGHVGTI